MFPGLYQLPTKGHKSSNRIEVGISTSTDGLDQPMEDGLLTDYNEEEGGRSIMEEAMISSLSEMLRGNNPVIRECVQYLLSRGNQEEETLEAIEKELIDPTFRWYTQCRIRGKTYWFLVDSGASVSIIHPEVYEEIGGEEDKVRRKAMVQNADGTVFRTTGRVMLPVCTGQQAYLLAPYIGNVSDQGILGLDFLKLYGGALEGDTGKLTIKYPRKQVVQCIKLAVRSPVYTLYQVVIPGGESASISLREDELLHAKQLLVEPESVSLDPASRKAAPFLPSSLLVLSLKLW